MDIEELKSIMLDNENENLEFKSANKGSFSVLGGESNERRSVLGYCVALGNEGGGRLILGVTNTPPRIIVGTKSLENFEQVRSQVYRELGARIDLEEVIDEDGKRVVIVDIPSRPVGQVFKFRGIPLMRVGEELVIMDDATLTRILNESMPDWSAKACPKASIEDLDPMALSVARENFKIKNPKIAHVVDTWTDEVFLNKAKLSVGGAITNTAIILLGKPESVALISPSVSQITWILKDKDGVERDYEHFSSPLILAVEAVYSKIRNLKYRYIKDETLFPEEIDMYDPYIIREALNNCIAHQNYLLACRIQVVESEDGFLVFTNAGRFLPGSVEKVIQSDSPQSYYTNKFLADAMVNLNMIDTIGSGIRKMFTLQRDRFFPLPSYDFINETVELKIVGKVIDVDYARLLARDKNLSLADIMLLDKIQKKKAISKEQAEILRKRQLIEGRFPTIYISKKIAEKTGEKAQYIKNRGLDNEYYRTCITTLLEKYPRSSRKEINSLIFEKLADVLTEEQKTKKISNILSAMSKLGLIKNMGSDRNPEWVNTSTKSDKS